MTYMGVHHQELIASMDRAVGELVDALNVADQCGAWSVPAHRRDAEQDEAVIRVCDAQEEAEEYMQLFITDRYGLDPVVQLQLGVL